MQGPRHVDERRRAHPSGCLRQSIALRSVPRSLSLGSLGASTFHLVKSTVLLFFLSSIPLFAAAPWPGVKYTEVRAYAWSDAIPSDILLIKPDWSFVDGVLNKEGALLNARQTKSLLAAESRRRIDRGVAGCYAPHNAFVFYNAEKKPVAFLEICFDCFGSRCSPVDEEGDPDFGALATIFSELKLPIGKRASLNEVRESWRTELRNIELRSK